VTGLAKVLVAISAALNATEMFLRQVIGEYGMRVWARQHGISVWRSNKPQLGQSLGDLLGWKLLRIDWRIDTGLPHPSTSFGERLAWLLLYTPILCALLDGELGGHILALRSIFLVTLQKRSVFPYVCISEVFLSGKSEQHDVKSRVSTAASRSWWKPRIFT
jgi:hypothetical protein